MTLALLDGSARFPYFIVHIHVKLDLLFFQILLYFCSSVLKPVLYCVSHGQLPRNASPTYVDLIHRDSETLGKSLLSAGARLVLLLEVGFEDIMLLLCEARLDVGTGMCRILSMLFLV